LIGFPIKRTAARKYWLPYLEKFGDRCVEVDAIPADGIRARVEAAIQAHIDMLQWQRLQAIEETEKESLLATVGSLSAPT
jgi:hypothetical protein